MLVNVDSPSEQEQLAEVENNHVIGGKLQVTGNERVSVRQNIVRQGDITCEDNDQVDTYKNWAVDGTVECGKRIFKGDEI